MSYEHKENDKHAPFLFGNNNKDNLVQFSFDIIHKILIDTLNKSNSFNLNFSYYPLFKKSMMMKDNLKHMNMVNEAIDKNQGDISMKHYSNEEYKAILDNYDKSISKTNQSSRRLDNISNGLKDSKPTKNVIDMSYQSNNSSFFAEGLIQESTIEFDSATNKSSTNIDESNAYDYSSNRSTKSTKIIKIGKKNGKISHSKEKPNQSMSLKKIPPRPESQKEISIPLSLQKLKIAPRDNQITTHQLNQSFSPIKPEIFKKKRVINPKGEIEISKQQKKTKSKSPKPHNHSIQIDMFKPTLVSSPSQSFTQHSFINNNTVKKINLQPSYQGSSKNLLSYASLMKQKQQQSRESRNLSCDIIKEKSANTKSSNKHMEKQYSTSKDLKLMTEKDNSSLGKPNMCIDIDSKCKTKPKPKMNFDIDLSTAIPSNQKDNKPNNLKENKIIIQDQPMHNHIKEKILIENILIETSTSSDKLKKLKELKSKQEKKKETQTNFNLTAKQEVTITIEDNNVVSTQPNNNNADNSSLNDRFSFKKPQSKPTKEKNNASNQITPGQTKGTITVKHSLKLNFKVYAIIDESVFKEVNFLN